MVRNTEKSKIGELQNTFQI